MLTSNEGDADASATAAQSDTHYLTESDATPVAAPAEQPLPAAGGGTDATLPLGAPAANAADDEGGVIV